MITAITSASLQSNPFGVPNDSIGNRLNLQPREHVLADGAEECEKRSNSEGTILASVQRYFIPACAKCALKRECRVARAHQQRSRISGLRTSIRQKIAGPPANKIVGSGLRTILQGRRRTRLSAA